ncbi:304_t:CDS:2, partial [Diversispora eburnea]
YQASTHDFQKMLQDGFNKQQELLKKQQTEHKAEIEKLKADFDTKITKQPKKIPPSVPPKDYEEIHEHYASQGDPNRPEFTKEEFLREVTKLFGTPPVQPKPERLRSSNQTDEIRSLRNEIIEIRNAENQSRDALNQMYNRYKNLSADGHTTNVKSNRIAEPQQNKIVDSPVTTFDKLFPESDDQLLELLSPAMRKKITNPSTKNKWAESIEYMQCRIDDVDIPEGFPDSASECNLMNKALNDALGWDLGTAPNFYLTHNSDHVTKLIGGHKDVPISIIYKDKQGIEHLVTETANIVIIDDGEPDYLLCMGTPYIRKVKGLPDLDKHEFRMTVRGKSYVIPTFTKPTGDISDNQPSSKISSCCTALRNR